MRRPRTGCGEHRDGGERARGKRAETLGCHGGEQNRCHRHGFDHRSGHGMAAELFDGDDEIDRVGPETVVLLRDEQTVDAGLGQSLPHLQTRCRVAAVPRTDHLRHVRLGEQGVDTGREVLMGLVECESHRSPLGRPSSRSAMTFFWISLVPA